MLVLCKLVSGTFWSVFWLGDIVSLLGGGRGAFPSGLEPDGPDVLFPVPSVSCCIMCIISSICSFRKAILVTFSFTRERPLVDISLAQDLVIMGSRCDGNLDYFLREIFSLYNLGKNKRMGWERDGGTFENFDKVETQTNTKFRFLLTQNASIIFQILAWTLEWVLSWWVL